MHLTRVPTEAIDTGHGLWHIRVRMEPHALARLQEDLRLNGQREPLTVRPDPDRTGSFQLVVGSRRLAAARALGWSTVLVRVLNLDPAQAATLALANEIDPAKSQTYLERGWAATRTQQLRADGGLPAGIRSMARELGMKRSTLANALRVGKSFPRPLVEGIADKLDIPLTEILDIPQAPLLVITSQDKASPKGLLTTAVEAHVARGNPLKAVQAEMASAVSSNQRRPSHDPSRNRLQRHGDARFELRMDAPASVLPAAQARTLAAELRAAADEIERTCPTAVQPGQWLDTYAGWVRWLGDKLRRWARKLLASLRGDSDG